MRKYAESVSSAVNGLPVYLAEISVLKADMSPASLFSDQGVTPLAQPVLTDGLGAFSFYVADGTYTLVVADPGGANPRLFPNTEIFEDARNVSVPIGEAGLVLPSVGARAGNVLAFDSDGGAIAVPAFTGDPSADVMQEAIYRAGADSLLDSRVTAIETEVDALQGTITSGRRAYSTYASAVSDAATPVIYPAVTAGTIAEVPITDAGTHTDPVVGGTVANTGIFRWSASPAGWERLYDTDAASAEPFADAAAVSETNAAASAAAAATSMASLYQTYTEARGRTVTPIAGSGLSAAGKYIISDPFTHAGTVTSFKFPATVTGTATLEIWSKVGTTYTQIATRTVTVSATGNQAFTDADLSGLTVAAGNVFVFKGSANGIGAFTSGQTADGAGYAQITPSATSASNPTLTTNTRIEVQASVTYNEQVVTGTRFVAAESNALAAKAGTDLLAVAYTQTLGTTADPITTTGASSAGTYIFTDVVPYAVPVTSFKINARASGTIKLKRFARSGAAGNYTYTQTGFISITVPGAGLQTTSIPGLTLAANECLGYYQAGAVMGYVSAAFPGAGLSYVGAGDLVGPFTSLTPNSAGFTFQIQAVLGGTPQVVDATSYLALAASVAAVATTSSAELIAFGDSMTQDGNNGGGPGWCAQLATLLGRTVTNNGVGAQKTADILGRYGSFPVIVPALTIPTSGTVDFAMPITFSRSNPLTAVNSASTFAVTLSGVSCTLSYVSAGSGLYNYRLTRVGSGSAVPVVAGTPMLFTTASSNAGVTALLWPGRNSVGLQETTGKTADQQYNFHMDSVARAIDFMTPRVKHFTLSPVFNRNDEYSGSAATVAGAALNGSASYDLIVRIEEAMQERWPDNFDNTRRIVVAAYNSGVPQDVIDFGRDVPPFSLRATGDPLHLNTTGDGVVAAAKQAFLTAKGY